MRLLHSLWIWLKDTEWDRAAGYIRTGILTSESFRKPFHVGLTAPPFYLYLAATRGYMNLNLAAVRLC
jgi:hypothetical protein